MSISPNLKYPYQWAKRPVNAFVEKYARGTYNLSLITGVAPGLIRHRFCLILAKGNSLRWESIKQVVKVLDQDNPEDYRQLDDVTRHNYFKNLLYVEENRLLDENTT